MDSIQLSGDLTIYQVAELKTRLQHLLISASSKKTVEIDLNDIVECDGAGLQLLLAFSHAMAAEDRRLSLKNTPPVLMDLLKQFSLNDHFDVSPKVQ